VSEANLKEDPEMLALRSKPRAVTRLNPRSIVILVTGTAVLVLGACLWAFRPKTAPKPDAQVDARAPQSVPRAEGLDALPHDYDAWRPIPKLGSPAGELGRPVLHAEQNAGLESLGSDAFRPNPEVDAQRVERLRLQEESQAAAKAQVFFQTSHMRREAGGTPGGAGAETTQEAPARYTPGAGIAPSAEEGSERDQGHKRGFLDAKSDSTIYASGSLQRVQSPYELMAGTVIAAALVTGVNSDLPGQMIATVTQNIYDTVTGNYLLIPQGSRMMGSYDAQVAFGQRRVLLVWTRLIMPDGTSITLDRLQGVDVSGYAGLEDQVNSHWGRIFAGAAVSTLLGINAELATPNQTLNSGSVTVAIRQSSQDSLNQVGQQLTRKNLNVQPTLTVRPGFPLRIIVNKDLILRPYGHG
jgi:type IV secretory pathway VirB10-like protein